MPAILKGGSEPGVATLNYLATTRTGQSYVVSALAANPSAPIPSTAAAQLIGAIKTLSPWPSRLADPRAIFASVSARKRREAFQRHFLSVTWG